ncbi:hypothetical protein LCM17_06540 [Cereibacter sphaeroides]|nr:hypothetical protein [Cereibacter sphaeroides]
MAKKSKAPAALPSRTAILVLGMHRSGTSALAGVLSRLGCALPNALMEASAANAKGFFESTAVRDFNEEILASAGSSWDDFLPFNSTWIESPVAAGFLERAVALVQDDFGAAPLFVLKDPRICRLVPFWTQALEAAGCAVRPLLTVRNPNEVARSLRQKKGFTGALSQMIWLRHALDAEASTRSLPRFHTSYEMLIRRWPQVAMAAEQSLGLRWPRSVEQAEVPIENFLSSELRHHREASEDLIDNPLLVTWLRDSYAIFTRWAEKGEDRADHATLDTIRSAFDESSRAFSRLVLAEREERQQLSGTLRKVETEKTALEKNLAEHAARVADESRRVRSLETAREAAEQEMETLRRAEEQARLAAQEAADSARASIAELEAEVVKRAGLHKAAQRSAADAEAQLAEVQQARSALEADLAKRETELAAAREQDAAALAELRASKDTLTRELTAERDKVQALDAHMQESIAVLEADLAERDAALIAAREQNAAALAERRASEDTLTRKLTAERDKVQALDAHMQESIAALEADLAERDAALTAAREQNAGQVNEMAALAATVSETQTALQAARDDLTRAQEAAGLQHEQNAAALSELLANKEALNETLSAERSKIQALEADLRNAELRDEASQSELGALRGQLSQMQSALIQRQHEAETTAATLAETQSSLAQRNTELSVLALEVTQRDAELGEACVALQERFHEVATLTQHAMRQQAQIEKLSDSGEVLQAKIAESRALNETLGAEAAKTVQELEALKEEMSRLREALATAEHQRDGYGQEVHALRHSTSWRMTGPLRRMVLLFRR